ncbi:MAG: GNAT family N-acetyltransferase [Streptosporangiaceae bacterium]
MSPFPSPVIRSARVAERAGFRREGTLRRAGLEDDGLHDLAVFSLLDDEL